ncbi:hypothetical protein MGG_16687 [Pyricularia oryzae 70-15]|uniref:Uncharacterized protein n=2 Tax=Pyricularia oryzae TaxID=318829 RepID=G4N3D5_PYRO7|nr:uncharacterized protein MGG_16687 [Pyricularia oryzae 70-15]EHA51813.1 hypothetical protein MGG_16687 [Pyricularia oryzae 70-15]KAI7922412.1 hypothetical protein M9X92_004846 [Pyricularia oryzae]
MSYALAAYPNRYTVIQTGDRNGNTLPAAVVDGVVTHPFHYGCPPASPEQQTQCPRSSSILVTFSHLLPRTAQQPLFKTKAQPASRNRVEAVACRQV